MQGAARSLLLEMAVRKGGWNELETMSFAEYSPVLSQESNRRSHGSVCSGDSYKPECDRKRKTRSKVEWSSARQPWHSLPRNDVLTSSVNSSSPTVITDPFQCFGLNASLFCFDVRAHIQHASALDEACMHAPTHHRASAEGETNDVTPVEFPCPADSHDSPPLVRSGGAAPLCL